MVDSLQNKMGFANVELNISDSLSHMRCPK